MTGRVVRSCAVFVGTAVVMLAIACGSSGDARVDPAGPAAAATDSSAAPPACALPDTSKAAASVQQQLKAAHAALATMLQQPQVAEPQLAAAYGEVGKLLMAADFGRAAEDCLLNAQRLAPSDHRWPYYLAHLYKERGAAEQSRASFERVLQLRADDVASLIWLGESELDRDRPESAELRFAQARSIQPRAAAAVAGLGRAALARRQYAAAVPLLEDAAALDPQAAIIQYSLAMAYRGLGDLAKAELQLQHPAKGDLQVPDPLMQELRSMLKSASAFETLGVTALERGDAAGAAAYFRKGLEIAPGSASLHQRLGTALLLTGDAAGGRKAIEAALQIDPRFARAHYSQAVLMLSSGQYQLALDRLSAAIEADPKYLEARLLRADVLRSGGRAAEALREYGEVLAIDAHLRQALLGDALSRVLLGQYRHARDRLSAALAEHPGEPAFVEALVRLLAAAPDGAVRDGSRALALASGFGPARTPEQSEAVAMAYAETGDFTRAVAEQRAAMATADGADRAPHIRAQMVENLRLFERGQPCRQPWREGTMP